VNHQITNTVKTDAGTSVVGTRYESGTSGTAIDQVFAVVADAAIPVSWTLAGLQSIILLSDKAATIKVNSSGSPDATISLKAGSPFVWSRSDAYYAYPFGSASSVTNLYITTTAGTRFQALILGA
jgi:hypothetical protein